MKYTDSHEWIRVEGNEGCVGISEHAQKELGEIVYIELPEIGRTVQAGEEIAVLESTKAAADIYSPVSGTVLKVNEQLKSQPQLINESPEDEGWIFEVAVTNPAELKSLMSHEDYISIVE